MLWLLRAGASQMRVVDTDMLLKLLDPIPLGQLVQTARMAIGNMRIGKERVGGDARVRGESVQRVGQHLVGWSRTSSPPRRGG